MAIDDRLLNAQKKLSAIADQRKALDEEEAKIKLFIQMYHAMGSGAEEHPKASARSTSGVHHTVINAVKELLSDRVPRKTRLIYAELERQKIKLDSENPEGYLSVILSNSGLFRASRANGWTLRL